MKFRGILFLLMLFLAASCDDEKRCYEATDTLMVVNLLGSTEVEIDSIVVKGVDRNDVGDTIYRDTLDALVKHFKLPLSLSADSTGFDIFTNGRSARFYINHTMQVKLVSEDCGFAPYYEITGGRFSANIDSILVTDPVVNPKSSEIHAKTQNIIIFYNLADR